MKTPKFTLSNKAFGTLKEAEEKAMGYLQGGQFNQNMKCYKVVEVYKPTIKFVKIK